MAQFNIHEAKTQLSKLIARAEAGEEIVIARDGRPLVRMDPVSVPQGVRAIVGCMKGELRIPSDEDWRRMDDEIAREMIDGPLFPGVAAGEAAE